MMRYRTLIRRERIENRLQEEQEQQPVIDSNENWDNCDEGTYDLMEATKNSAILRQMPITMQRKKNGALKRHNRAFREEERLRWSGLLEKKNKVFNYIIYICK